VVCQSTRQRDTTSAHTWISGWERWPGSQTTAPIDRDVRFAECRVAGQMSRIGLLKVGDHGSTMAVCRGAEEVSHLACSTWRSNRHSGGSGGLG